LTLNLKHWRLFNFPIKKRRISVGQELFKLWWLTSQNITWASKTLTREKQKSAQECKNMDYFNDRQNNSSFLSPMLTLASLFPYLYYSRSFPPYQTWRNFCCQWPASYQSLGIGTCVRTMELPKKHKTTRVNAKCIFTIMLRIQVRRYYLHNIMVRIHDGAP